MIQQAKVMCFQICAVIRRKCVSEALKITGYNIKGIVLQQETFNVITRN